MRGERRERDFVAAILAVAHEKREEVRGVTRREEGTRGAREVELTRDPRPNWKIIIITLEINGHLEWPDLRDVRSKVIYAGLVGDVWAERANGGAIRDAPIIERIGDQIADGHAYRVWRHMIVLRAKTRPAFTPGDTAGQSSLWRRIYCRLSRDRFFSFFLSAPIFFLISFFLSPSIAISF